MVFTVCLKSEFDSGPSSFLSRLTWSGSLPSYRFNVYIFVMEITFSMRVAWLRFCLSACLSLSKLPTKFHRHAGNKQQMMSVYAYFSVVHSDQASRGLILKSQVTKANIALCFAAVTINATRASRLIISPRSLRIIKSIADDALSS